MRVLVKFMTERQTELIKQIRAIRVEYSRGVMKLGFKPSTYGFVYYLVRHSGFVEKIKNEAIDDCIKELEQSSYYDKGLTNTAADLRRRFEALKTANMDLSTAGQKDQSQNTRELSFGEQLVGISFNPSNDGDVAEIKTKMAELANLLHKQYQSKESSQLDKLIYEGAIQRILDAQMWAVKYVTLKY